ncbi:MAG: universal stress protein [Desulfobacterales bacterium]|nr:universal stress protein [Pseudomonadota bacterium]MBU4357431.1 universal stress protein [Pseudomonadota bacterium]MCG2772844.1 universal stress protein [Desulfobacterales bacterium]
MEVRTILWPTDLSKNSIQAAKHVSSLALKYEAKVILLYVGVDLLSMFPAYGTPSEGQLQHFHQWELEQAKKHLEAVCAKELKACPNIEVKLVQGDAAAEILKTIKEAKADLVILTSHGRGHEDLDQKSADFGSVAKKVLANSPVPVHLVNPYTK